jgi:hypothetical protein
MVHIVIQSILEKGNREPNRMSKTLMLCEKVYILVGGKSRGKSKGEQVAHFMGFEY